MSTTALLLGFEYSHATNKLPGALIDLYHAYSWCISSTIPPSSIHVLTDISGPNQYVAEAIKKNLEDANLSAFYSDIEHMHIVYTEHQLELGIQNAVKNVTDRLVIYYTGHGVDEMMLLPNGSRILFVRLRDMILGLLEPYVEIFWILDCCNPDGLHLPYKLTGNKFSLSPTKIHCITQPILLITSAESNEKSVATKYGSVFSRILFRVLSLMNSGPEVRVKGRHVTVPLHRNRNLRRMVGMLMSSIRKFDTGYIQTVSIYSSYVINPVLWSWIGSDMADKYDIVSDMSLSTLIVRNLPGNQEEYDQYEQ